MDTDNNNTNNPEKDEEVGFTIEHKITACKNCEEDYEVGYQFCPHCGQKTDEDLTVGVLFYNTISNYFSFDARFFKSFIPLMFKPGILAKRFIEGKRLLYLHPAQMYLFISVVFFFLFSIVSRDFVNKSDSKIEKEFKEENVADATNKKVLDSIALAELVAPLKNTQMLTGMDDEELEKLDSIITASANAKDISDLNFGFDRKKLDSLIVIEATEAVQLKAMGLKEDAGFFVRRFYTQGLKIYKQSGRGVIQAFLDSIPISLFILLPIFAMILKLFFWRRGTFAHHLVFSFYYYSFLFTVLSIILISNLIWEVPDWIDWLVMSSTFFYLFFAIKRFYRQGYFVSFFKTCVATFVYMTFVIPIAIGVMMAGAFMFY